MSVVVPTFNRRDRLERVLQALADQDLDESYEVVVVSDGSTDGTDRLLAAGVPGLTIRYECQSNSGPAAARNRGVDLARGDLIVFLDDDVVPAPQFLRMHIAAHRREGSNAVVVGPMLDPVDHSMSPYVRWEQHMLARQYRAMEEGEFDATARQFYTGNASVARRHLNASGGFDASYRRAEDFELALRLSDMGLSFHFEPSAVGWHYAERSYEAWRAIAFEYGRNEMQFASRGRGWIGDSIRTKYVEKLWPVRASIGACLRWPHVARLAEYLLRKLASIAEASGSRRVNRSSLSLIYVIVFLAGVQAELGSNEAFRQFAATQTQA